MQNCKQSLFLLLWICIISFGYAQDRNSILSEIKKLDKEKIEHQERIEVIDRELEQLKLNRVRVDLNLNGLAKSDADAAVANHSMISIGYNEKHEQPNWVAHMITSDILAGRVKRTNDFRVDSLIPSGTAVTEDYWDSGYDRGHLAPSADFRWSRKALSESYFYSNMSPQLPEFNRGIWAEFENEVREWAIYCKELYVVTGGILEDGLPTIGKQNQVSIPKYFYKVLLDYQEPELKGIGFLFPHKGGNEPVLSFAVPIDSIEKLSGVDFFYQLPDDIEEKLESTLDLDKWPMDAVWGDPKDTLAPIKLVRGQIRAEDATHYVGSKITVCGKVVSTRYSAKGKTSPTYINLDYRFPNQVFTAVVHGKDRINFSYEPDQYLKDKRVCFTGRVGEFKGTPQMIITDEHKVEVLD